MALSIRNAETESAARRLAQLTGKGITESIHEAITARLASLEDSPRATARRRQRIDEAVAKVRQLADGSTFATDAELYDEQGLPR